MNTALYITVLILLCAWLFKRLSIPSNARKKAKKLQPNFHILPFDEANLSDDLKYLARWIEEEYGSKPIISSKLPSEAGDNILTIEEVGRAPDEREIFVERIDGSQFCKLNRQCKAGFEHCQCAVQELLAA